VAQDGSSTTSETTTNQDGTSHQTQSTTTAPDQEGATLTNATTVNYDANGDETGSQTKRTTAQSGGSFESVITNYDTEDNPTLGFNESGDADGTVLRQDVAYDANENQTVIGYHVDTSKNSDGAKEIDGSVNGINTGFYAFDPTVGFKMNLHFYIDFEDQPTNLDDSGIHPIFVAKRMDPTPWYGFELRQSGTDTQFGFIKQFETGNN